MKNIFLMTILVAAIVGSYFFVDINTLFDKVRGEVKFVQQASDCDLHAGPCKITLDDGVSFTLEVYPKEIPLMKPVKFKISSENYNKEIIPIDVYANNMNMGTQTIKLKRVEENSYESTVILPTCIRGNMKWDADIVIDKLTHQVGAKFKFKTDY